MAPGGGVFAGHGSSLQATARFPPPKQQPGGSAHPPKDGRLAEGPRCTPCGTAAGLAEPSFALIGLMRRNGLDTQNAQAAREGFAREVAKMRGPPPPPGATPPPPALDLARAALQIAAEDDALVCHSPVALPVDAYLERLDSMAAELAGHHLPPAAGRQPDAVFRAMDHYIYSYKGFRRPAIGRSAEDARDYYLNGVLTRTVGTSVMLALIYNELASRLRQLAAIDFAVEMVLPLGPVGLPYPRVAGAADSRLPAPPRGAAGGAPDDLPAAPFTVLTPQLLLYEVLRSLKELFWPWRWSRASSGGSGFLEAAAAHSEGAAMGIMGPASRGGQSSSTAAQAAAARAAGYRLQRGIWTSSGFGDMRRALAACERLVMLGVDEREGRDYGVLLFHCGLYRQAFAYLSAYCDSHDMRAPATTGALSNSLERREALALRALLDRLQLLLAESQWGDGDDANLPPPKPLPEPW